MRRPAFVDGKGSSSWVSEDDEREQRSLLESAIRELRVLELELSEDSLSDTFGGAPHLAQAMEEFERARIFLFGADEVMSRVFRLSATENLFTAARFIESPTPRAHDGQLLVAIESYQRCIHELKAASRELQLLRGEDVLEHLGRAATLARKACRRLYSSGAAGSGRTRH